MAPVWSVLWCSLPFTYLSYTQRTEPCGWRFLTDESTNQQKAQKPRLCPTVPSVVKGESHQKLMRTRTGHGA
jgi:hypothetical protein